MENQPTMSNNSVQSTTDWLITLIITAIPLVGFIMLFVWAFGSDTNENKANWAKATLIIYAIVFALSLIFMAIFGATMFAAMDNYNG